MTSAGLHDVGILVTRPRAQATALVRTIEREGGRAIRFPVMEIKARAEDAIKDAVSALPTPDIAVFASPNAVEHGLRHVGGGKMAAIGPATAAAIQAAGRIVDILPASGYDSESLLDEPLLNNVVRQDRTDCSRQRWPGVTRRHIDRTWRHGELPVCIRSQSRAMQPATSRRR